MSNPEVGEAFVRLRVDPGDFDQQITDTVEAGAEKAQQSLDSQLQAQAQAIQDLRLKAEAAQLRSLAATGRGDQSLARAEELSAGLLSLQANIAQAEFAAQDALRSAASAMGVEREQLLAAAEAYQVAAKIGQDTLDRSRQAGRILEPKVPGQEQGTLGRLEELARGAGTRGGLGQLLAAGGRLGAIGLAATAAFQGLNELSNSLKVSGDEAFTAEGRFRNLGSELLTGNFIGGIKALAAERKALLSSGLQEALARDKAALDPLTVTEEKLTAARRKGVESLDEYIAILQVFGGVSDKQAEQLRKITDELIAQEAAARTAANAVGDVERAIERAGSAAAAFGERENDFGRGPAAIAQERQRAIEQGPTFSQGTGGTQVGNEIRASITSRIQDDQKRLAAELENAKVIQAQKRATFENVRHTDEAAAAWKDYVVATTAVVNATAAAKKATQDAATAAQDAANTIRDAQAGRIADEGQRLQAELANARIVERQKQAAAAAAKGTADAAQANAAYEQAVTARVQIERQIQARNEEVAKAAVEERRSTEEAKLANAEARAALTPRLDDDRKAIKATRDYYLALAKELKGSAAEEARSQAIAATARLRGLNAGDAEELAQQRLSNAVAAASLTGRLSDDRKAAQDLVKFWKSQVQDAEGLAKARAEGNLLDAKARLAAVDNQADQLKEQRLRNRQAAAQLTKGLDDDKAAADALIKYWQDQVKHAEGLEKERARSNLIAARLARQNLDKQPSGDTGPSTIDFLGISQQIFRDFAGNLLPTGSAQGVANLFKLPGIQGVAAGAGPEQEQVDELRRIRQLLERNGTGATVHVNQEFKQPDTTGFAQAHFARFAMEEAFNG